MEHNYMHVTLSYRQVIIGWRDYAKLRCYGGVLPHHPTTPRAPLPTRFFNYTDLY